MNKKILFLIIIFIVFIGGCNNDKKTDPSIDNDIVEEDETENSNTDDKEGIELPLIPE